MSDESSIRTCTTCRYRSNNPLLLLLGCHGLLNCNRPNRKLDPVTGKPEEAFCSVERNYNHCCGEIGRFHSDIYPAEATDGN